MAIEPADLPKNGYQPRRVSAASRAATTKRTASRTLTTRHLDPVILA